MTDITTLASEIEAAKANGTPITLKVDDLTGLLRLASVMGDAIPAMTSLADSFRTITQSLPDPIEQIAEDEVITIKTICAKLGISRQTLYRWRREGVFTPKPINQRGTKWMRRDFIQWMQTQRS